MVMDDGFEPSPNPNPSLPISLRIELVAESSSAGDLTLLSVPAPTSSTSIEAAACIPAGLHWTTALRRIPPLRRRWASATAPDFPSMATHAISDMLCSRVSAICHIPVCEPYTS